MREEIKVRIQDLGNNIIIDLSFRTEIYKFQLYKYFKIKYKYKNHGKENVLCTHEQFNNLRAKILFEYQGKY